MGIRGVLLLGDIFDIGSLSFEAKTAVKVSIFRF